MIKYEELIDEHCFAPMAVQVLVDRLIPTDHVLLYRNTMMDSSCFGRRHLVLAGPGRTIADPDHPPPWIDPDDCGGLPSRRAQFVGEVDVDSVREASGSEE